MLASGGAGEQFFRNLNSDPQGGGVYFPAVQKNQTPLPLSLVHLPITGPYSLWNMRNYLGMKKSGLPVKQTSPQHQTWLQTKF